VPRGAGVQALLPAALTVLSAQAGAARPKAGISLLLCSNRTMQPILLQNTLPLMATILERCAATVVGWIANSNLSKRLDDIIKRLERIEYKLANPHERIAKLEETTSFLPT
jgi:hypothetical protein